MKKTWIKIKRGLITDPKHRDRMGECLWLFEYMLDRADWDTGKIYGWKDRDAADDMQMPLSTVRHQRRKMESEKYIETEQEQHGLTITIFKYVNPRKHADEILNIPDDQSDDPHMGGDEKGQGYNELTPSSQGDNQGDNEGDSQGDNTLTPPLKEPLPHTTDHKSLSTSTSVSEQDENAWQELFSTWERSGGPITPIIADDLKDMAEEAERHRRLLPDGASGSNITGAGWVSEAIKTASRSAKGRFNTKYVHAIVTRWIEEGFKAPRAGDQQDTVTGSVEDEEEWATKRKQKALEKIKKASDQEP